ncbi:MAG: 30S ribosomal protein S6 [bacterium]
MQDKKNKGEMSMDLEETNSTDPRVYEVGYLFVPTISEEELPVNYGDLKELIASFGGKIISDEMPKMINLSYTMLKVVANVRSKFDTAYFGWVKFEMDPQKVLELKKKLDLSPTIIRFLIIKTVKENTIATKRFAFRDSTHKKPVAKKEEGVSAENVEVNKEELDKEIDAMIAV